ncbi:non-ribosomal peptide synthetase [Streptomyces formicae]|uniref:Siderophore biosynthesis non-ribosomal peptide synthetase modules, Bacillibactin synthetase component F n=1 Tax=Streptomyces formicae TaxID=1616117 RepID=A0A291QDQ7_9ACTN|nr:non-ribosomal peptide synthetase [Streptomyces formicae]ATL29585.1 Siderophore biosynthesis non-ribosomal peptide synthetase modules, Bacillibactin synthetase component F [Streptomyces formicae]
MNHEVRNLPLLPAQESVLFAETAHGRPGTHNLALALRLTGPLDRTALDAALRQLTARHEALRVSIATGADGAVQTISADVTVTVEEADLTAVDPDTLDAVLAQHFTSAQDRPFRLDRAPLLRVTLLRLGHDRHVLLLVVHHSVADGHSMDVLAREFTTLYEAAAEGRPDPLGPPALSYTDHVTAALSGGSERRRARALDHWRTTLEGAPATLDLPMADLGGTTRRQAATHRHDLPRPAVARLRALADEQRTSLFSVLAAGAFALLGRYTGESDIVLGVPLSTRLAPGSEGLVALTVNTMPLRAGCADDQDFLTLLHTVQGRTFQALRHQGVAFHELVHTLNPPRSAGRQPVFQLGLNHMRTEPAAAPGTALRVEPLPVANATAAFELMLTFVETGDDVRVYVEYDTGRFGQDTVRALARHLANLLSAAADDPRAPLADIDLMDAAERRQVLHEWNDTAAPLTDDTVPSLFARQAALHGDATAVVCGAESLNYRELDRRSARLARLLAERGAGPGTFVGLSLHRSADTVVALLAVLRTGAAYVPLDPVYPAQRLAHMLADAAPALVLTESGAAGGLPTGPGTPPQLLLDDPAVAAALDADDADAAFACPVTADQTAYVIYTSGSTGRPKGVPVTHRNVANLAAWAADAFGDGLARVLAATSLNFDVSVFEILGPLLNGGSIEIVRDLLEIGERGGWHGTLVSGVPSVLARLIADGAPDLRADHLVLAGEALTAPVAARLRAAVPGARLVNAYGPTETTVYASASATGGKGDGRAEEDAPPIGGPLRNTRLYVLDDRMRPVPVGVPGELYIAGAGVTQGYLHRPDLTESRFVPDPFADPSTADGPGTARMYRSGDIVLRRPDGQLRYVGRSDDQVKLRGFRVEPSEIEAVIAEQHDVAQAVVVPHEDRHGEHRLVAYVTAAPGTTPDPARLRAASARLLPEYMVPAAVVLLDELPLSPAGKLDRARLPDPGFGTSEGRAPHTPDEIAVAALFADALGLDRVSATDSFFDLGGHSLLAMRLVGRVSTELRAELTVRDLFETPTVEGLARRLRPDDTAQAPTKSDDFAVLLPLRTRGDKPPLFCFHPGFGLSWSYAALTRRLDQDQPVYALQARGIGRDEELPASYDELLDDYVRQLRTVQPAGPYRLLGWSFGGLVAHSLAARLQAEGHDVELLAMLDTVLVGTDEDLAPDEMRALIEAETADIRQVVPDTERLMSVVENLIRLRAQYRPEPYRGDVLYFTAANEPGRPESVCEPWEPHVEGRLVEHRVDCVHLDMMKARPAREIGDLLGKALDAVAAR